jgi:GDP-L-fucose synthase
MLELDINDSVFVAGHGGLVGSAIIRKLKADGFTNILTANRSDVDLRNQAQVNAWFEDNQPKYVFLVAGTVGGIHANATRPAEFLYDNMMIHATVVHASYVNNVEKLVYLGSSCIYPRLANQPMTEDQLLSGPLEPTNEPYAIAKIAGIKLCDTYREQYGCNFVSGMPTNLYGPNDNLMGLDSVEIWGSGTARREFLHVDDLADACLFLLRNYNSSGQINIGTGKEVSIQELAETLRDVIYPDAELHWDTTKPDGAPRKLLDVSKIEAAGWSHSIALSDGINSTYEWFTDQYENVRGR